MQLGELKFRDTNQSSSACPFAVIIHSQNDEIDRHYCNLTNGDLLNTRRALQGSKRIHIDFL